MIQVGHATGFTFEALEVGAVAGQLVRKHLDGDLLPLLFLIAQEDGAHAPLAEMPQDLKIANAP